jgi:hypothetical protein
MKHILFIAFLSFGITSFAQYGGKVDLRFTFEGRPMVGYTITGSINGIDIGGKGVTDRYGEVTLNTDKLPTPNIDIKGERSCGSNGSKSFEVSGVVYIANGNYHLELDKVVCMMQQDFGVETTMLLTSYGVFSCPGALGRAEDNRAATKPYQTTGYRTKCESFLSNEPSTENQSDTESSSSTFGNSSEATFIEKSDENNEEEEQERLEAERKKQEREQRMEDMMSGKTAAENYENARVMHQNKVNRLTNEISASKELLEREDSGSKKSEKLKYDIAEMEIERSIAALKLEKTEKEIANGNKPLTKAERQLYKAKEDDLKEEKKALKERRKSNKPFDDGNTESTETEPGETSQLYSEAEIANMSNFELKKAKLKTNSTLTKRKASLKMKGGLMKQDKKEALEQEIEALTKLVELMEVELENRKEEE